MLRIALCDDDMEFLDRFEALIHKCIEPYGKEYQIFKFTNGISMLAVHRQAEFDVVFLDIDMPMDSGISVAREFRESDNIVYIIFVTNHTKYVYDSFDVQPFHFIVKSSKQMFENKLNYVLKLLYNHMKQNQILVLEDSRNGDVSVAYRDIKYIESKAHYCAFHVKPRKGDKTVYRVRKKISELEEELKYYEFVEERFLDYLRKH